MQASKGSVLSRGFHVLPFSVVPETFTYPLFENNYTPIRGLVVVLPYTGQPAISGLMAFNVSLKRTPTQDNTDESETSSNFKV